MLGLVSRVLSTGEMIDRKEGRRETRGKVKKRMRLKSRWGDQSRKGCMWPDTLPCGFPARVMHELPLLLGSIKHPPHVLLEATSSHRFWRKPKIEWLNFPFPSLLQSLARE